MKHLKDWDSFDLGIDYERHEGLAVFCAVHLPTEAPRRRTHSVSVAVRDEDGTGLMRVQSCDITYAIWKTEWQTLSRSVPNGVCSMTNTFPRRELADHLSETSACDPLVAELRAAHLAEVFAAFEPHFRSMYGPENLYHSTVIPPDWLEQFSATAKRHWPSFTL